MEGRQHTHHPCRRVRPRVVQTDTTERERVRERQSRDSRRQQRVSRSSRGRVVKEHIAAQTVGIRSINQAKRMKHMGRGESALPFPLCEYGSRSST